MIIFFEEKSNSFFEERNKKIERGIGILLICWFIEKSKENSFIHYRYAAKNLIGNRSQAYLSFYRKIKKIFVYILPLFASLI